MLQVLRRYILNFSPKIFENSYEHAQTTQQTVRAYNHGNDQLNKLASFSSSLGHILGNHKLQS